MIRKLQIACGVQIGLVAVEGAWAAVPGAVRLSSAAQIVLSGDIVVVSVIAALLCMEALAAADLDRPIALTAHADRVGRGTKAMPTCRDVASAKIVHARP